MEKLKLSSEFLGKKEGPMGFKASLKKPHSLVVFWWIAWGFISILSLTDLFIPTAETYLVLSIFIFSLWGGGKLAHCSVQETTSQSDATEIQTRKTFNYLYYLSALFLFLVLSIVVFRCYFLMVKYIDPTIYRAIAFSTIEKVGEAFNNRLLENLYFLISSPMLLFLTIEGLVSFWENSEVKKLAIALLINGMDAFFRLGRVNIYMILLLVFFIFICSENKFYFFLKNKKREFGIFVFASLAILILGSLRGYSAIQQIKLFLIDYHTVGFSLFDHQLINPSSLLNTQLTYGRLTFGGLETMLTIILRQFDPSYYSPALLNSITLSKSVLVGIENPPTFIFNGIKYYNSFYTLLYTFYSDGRFLGVFIGGGILGYLVEYFYQSWQKNKKLIDGHFLILLISIVTMSIFVSQLEIMRTWMLIMLYLFIKFFLKSFLTRIL